MYHKYKNVERVKPGGLELKDSLVGVQRVTKVTKGGRNFGFTAIVVVGDENGVVGYGLGKSKDVVAGAKSITPKTNSMKAVKAVNAGTKALNATQQAIPGQLEMIKNQGK